MWHCYDGRAGRERYIREIRADYALTKIPTRAFAAHALYLEVMRLAYNLVTAFQRTGLPAERQSDTWSKLRHQLFWVPGELTRSPKPTYPTLSQFVPNYHVGGEDPAPSSPS